MDNFPVNAKQIRKYYKKPQCLTAGTLQARSKKQRRFHEPSASTLVAVKESDPQPMLEARNLRIGAEVGTDVFGPVANKCASLFRDKCGFTKSTFFAWSNRKQEKITESGSVNEVVKSLEWAINYFKTFQHPIEVLKTDALSTYKSSAVKDLCNKNQIR